MYLLQGKKKKLAQPSEQVSFNYENPFQMRSIEKHLTSDLTERLPYEQLHGGGLHAER
jgi:hypothetical protein